ncbi:hypothetical protein TVAG_210580 [Trichomonas vaginalis G3]|uniref:Thioredoxin domain-containing protein n=1 Tax=Trichomonas vaginalis (strain ATCC PRA-98 / G3) TaxID=412133 RepID=A2FV36_TRIV3|nr:disulfide-isomerase A6 family [Trichomonas vaginalis G3]EAX91233.1 hypothetical protein TVAG_210580 [Trichomonas vaginalis G3]KAI5528854.1 disulfide-isomerase A6 family [Trichomonas vaginalis G3]|eukprot:XP_001304163.1 hypothetical protein [Trichomonas vaginalis G3]
MFFVLFCQLAFQVANVITLTPDNWQQLVDKRDPESVWLIFFRTNGHMGSKSIFPIFENASRIADGLFNFGLVTDDPDFPVLMRYKVETVPTIIILHKTGYKKYKGKYTENDLLKAAAKFLKDHTKKATLEWINEPQDTAILFTDKSFIPSLWVGISSDFRNKLRIGVTNSTEVMRAYGVTKLPSIIMMNSSYRTFYKGRISFGAISQTLTDFIQDSYEEPYVYDPDYLFPDEYQKQTANFTGYIAFAVTDELEADFQRTKDTRTPRRFKFFYGTENLPYKFMTPGTYWILQPSKNRIAKCNSAKEIFDFCAKIVDGEMKWQDLNSYL